MRAREIRISKEVLPVLPEGYEETRLGEARGARRQFRSASGVHVREYEEEFLVHVDRFDPRSHPLRHLVMDSPGMLVTAGLFLASRSTKRSLPRERRRSALPGGILSFLFSVFLLAMSGLAGLQQSERKWNSSSFFSAEPS